MKLKRILSLLTALCLVGALLTGCGSTGGSGNQTESLEQDDPAAGYFADLDAEAEEDIV